MRLFKFNTSHKRIYLIVFLLGLISLTSACGGGGGGKTRDTTAPITTAILGGGTYGSTQHVALASDESATIYYSVDGNPPAVDAPNTISGDNPILDIEIAESTTLKFFAIDSAGNEEAIRTENYIIDRTRPTTLAYPDGGLYGAVQNITLIANEPATTYYSLDGRDPSVGGVNTISGESPITDIEIAETTTLKYFSIDSVGNRAGTQTEEYTIDLSYPDISFTSPPPAPFGVLTEASITWQSDKPVDYIVELGGNGNAGSGEELDSGSIAAETPVTHEINGSQLSFDGDVPLWVYATDQVEHTSSVSLNLTMKPTESILLGFGDVNDIVILPSGAKTYASYTEGFLNGNEIVVIETDPAGVSYNTLIDTIPVLSNRLPDKIAITPDGTRVYITLQGSNYTFDGILLVDTATDTELETISLADSDEIYPTGIAITPDGKRGYFVKGPIEVIDVNPASISYNQLVDRVNRIPRIASVGNIAVTPDGTKALVNWGNSINAVDVIDTEPTSLFYNTIIGTPVTLAPGGVGSIAVSPASDFAFVTSACSDCIQQCSLCKIDLETLEIVANLPVTDYQMPELGSIALTPDGQKILYVEMNSSQLYVINASDLSFVGGIELGASLGNSIAITPDGTRAYIMRDSYTDDSNVVMVPLL